LQWSAAGRFRRRDTVAQPHFRNAALLDPSLISFIKTSIPSVWALECLMLLRRAAPRHLTRLEIVHHLRATPALVERITTNLARGGLLKEYPDGHAFECATEQLDALCAELARVAEERPVAVRDAILSTPSDKLRDFSDAFRLQRKDK
jgi:hypothetical protein